MFSSLHLPHYFSSSRSVNLFRMFKRRSRKLYCSFKRFIFLSCNLRCFLLCIYRVTILLLIQQIYFGCSSERVEKYIVVLNFSFSCLVIQDVFFFAFNLLCFFFSFSIFISDVQAEEYKSIL